MRNLDLCEINVRNLNINSKEQLIICYSHDDNSCRELYVCSHNLVVRNFDENGTTLKWIKDLSETASPENRLVNATFLIVPNVLCVALANGEIYTISNSGEVCDLVGTCDNGLLAMEWSPDQEYLALVTKDFKTIFMTCTFYPIHEVDLLSEEFGEKQFVTVGWGKKETQFHGSKGKQAARIETETVSDPHEVSDKTVKITWRGDGLYYAIGFVMDGIRRFKVFDREGHLQFTSEKQSGLEANLAWRPSGNLIATTQKLFDKYIVAFFEKNGLRHGSFTLPVNSSMQVEDLVWNPDSEILALKCKDTIDNVENVLLFTSSNYHWFLKQTLSFNSEQKICQMIWDSDFSNSNSKKLQIFLQNGQFYTYSWFWNINHSKGKSNEDNAVVNVIDGKKILATGFRQTVVPPPMAASEIELQSFISSISFAPYKYTHDDVDTNTFFICTMDNKLIFYNQTQNFPLKYEVSKSISLGAYDFPFQYYNWHWLNSTTITCIRVDKNGYHYLVDYEIMSDKITERNVEFLPTAVSRIQSHPNDSSKLFLMLNNGDILQYTLDKGIEPQDISFKESCPKFDVVFLEDQLYFLGLSLKGNLYVNDTIIMRNVSSYFVHTHFLLVTTLRHILLCTELTKPGLRAIIDYEKNYSMAVYKRKIERGAKLVITVPCETRTILQMPRGNLETIQPRPLSLKIINEYLNSLKYHEALDLMRKQRINLNLIYDHDPEKFIKNIDVFLDCIENNSWLNLFLSDLENVDVTKTMYSSSYTERNSNVNGEIGTKIHKICDVIREYLTKRSDKDKRILPLLTTFVKKNTVEDLEKALNLIKELKLHESGGSKLPVGSDEALRYLLYMVDVNRLFDVALGMYDFELVLLVANKSQKDPKEYIPMLNELNDMTESYKKFTINKYLKRFDKAVESLAKCGPEKYGELKTFVKYHSLYRDALKLFSPDDEIYKEICEDFGSYLRLKKQLTEAGIVYEKAKNKDKAIICYKEALEWEFAIKLAFKWPQEQFKNLCRELINGLKEEKRHKEALLILEKFYDDKEETALYAIENGCYKTAIRLCTQFNLDDLKDNRLLLTLLEDYKNIQQLIETNWCTFIRHRDRLRIVRENKNKSSVESHDLSYLNKDSDLYSDVGSTHASSTSRSSSRTFRSSKNRRKHERKLASLKEGSQYEDVALVMALYNLVISSHELRLQVKEIATALSYFDRDKEAFVLQTTLDKLLKEMKDSFKEIWSNEFMIEATNASIAAQNVPDGSNVIPQGIASLASHMIVAPVIQDVNWKLNGLNF